MAWIKLVQPFILVLVPLILYCLYKPNPIWLPHYSSQMNTQRLSLLSQKTVWTFLDIFWSMSMQFLICVTESHRVFHKIVLYLQSGCTAFSMFILSSIFTREIRWHVQGCFDHNQTMLGCNNQTCACSWFSFHASVIGLILKKFSHSHRSFDHSFR